MNIGEVVRFKTHHDDAGLMRVELWFLEATNDELDSDCPPKSFNELSKLKKVSEKRLKFNLAHLFEHFVV